MIWLKIFLLFLSCFLFRGVWSRLWASFFRKAAPESPIFNGVLYSALQQALQSSVDHALLQPWIQMRARETSKRIWLVRLGLSSLAGFILLLMIFAWAHFLGLRGTFIEISQFQRLSEPPIWLLWMGESSLVQLFTFAIFGVLGSLIWRRPFFGVAFVAVFIFTGAISIAGGVSWLLGERLGLKLVFWRRHQSEMLKNEVEWSLFMTGLTIFGSVVCGRALVEVLTQFGFSSSFIPSERFTLLLVTLLLWTVIEVFVSMAFYHFYWLKYKANEQR